MKTFVRHAQDTEPIVAPQFLVGVNSRGNWVARDQKGLCGGLFIGRSDAMKFALSENGNRPEAVDVVPGILELDTNTAPDQQAQRRPDETVIRQSRRRATAP